MFFLWFRYLPINSIFHRVFLTFSFCSKTFHTFFFLGFVTYCPLFFGSDQYIQTFWPLHLHKYFQHLQMIYYHHLHSMTGNVTHDPQLNEKKMDTAPAFSILGDGPLWFSLQTCVLFSTSRTLPYLFVAVKNAYCRTYMS